PRASQRRRRERHRARAPLGHRRALVSRPGRALVYLRLGRVSNLPTVWTNTLCGVTLSNADLDAVTTAALASTMSLFYVGGMFLNDAFDREIDAKERPERPIPAGHIGATEVFLVGFGLLFAAIVLLATGFGGMPAIFGLALAFNIVLYDRWH